MLVPEIVGKAHAEPLWLLLLVEFRRKDPLDQVWPAPQAAEAAPGHLQHGHRCLRKDTAVAAVLGPPRRDVGQPTIGSDAALQPDVVSFSSAMTALSRQSLHKQAWGLLEDLPRHSLQPNWVIFNAAIDSCHRGASWQAALILLQRARHQSVLLDVVSHSLAVSTCVSSSQPGVASQLLEGMRQLTVQPDEAAYVGMLDACKEAACWALALSILAELRGDGPQSQTSDQTAYALAMGSCEAARQWELALSVLATMQHEGPSPNLVTLNAAVMALATAGRTAEALCVVRHAEDLGLVSGAWQADANPTLPEADVDLHRFPAELARFTVLAAVLDAAIDPSRKRGLVFVTGRGTHGGTAVLKAVIGECLKEFGLAVEEGDAEGTDGRLWLPPHVLQCLAFEDEKVLDAHFNIKVCDFGKTQELRSNCAIITGQDTGGSPRYMAPECFILGAHITEKVDIWSLGCCLVEASPESFRFLVPDKNPLSTGHGSEEMYATYVATAVIWCSLLAVALFACRETAGRLDALASALLGGSLGSSSVVASKTFTAALVTSPRSPFTLFCAALPLALVAPLHLYVLNRSYGRHSLVIMSPSMGASALLFNVLTGYLLFGEVPVGFWEFSLGISLILSGVLSLMSWKSKFQVNFVSRALIKQAAGSFELTPEDRLGFKTVGEADRSGAWQHGYAEILATNSPEKKEEFIETVVTQQLHGFVTSDAGLKSFAATAPTSWSALLSQLQGLPWLCGGATGHLCDDPLTAPLGPDGWASVLRANVTARSILAKRIAEDRLNAKVTNEQQLMEWARSAPDTWDTALAELKAAEFLCGGETMRRCEGSSEGASVLNANQRSAVLLGKLAFAAMCLAALLVAALGCALYSEDMTLQYAREGAARDAKQRFYAQAGLASAQPQAQAASSSPALQDSRMLQAPVMYYQVPPPMLPAASVANQSARSVVQNSSGLSAPAPQGLSVVSPASLAKAAAEPWPV
ncbi:unnamed protein product [Symbiodinium sp. CCMP2592]|nr:unnamed protein product [Symbiodinium sp. CCMP2592]